MTIEDAINNLKRGKCIPYKHETLTLVIESLDAWEKVRTEIENLYEYTSREDYIHQEETRAFIDKSEVLEIIDKYRGE